jgi:hypothetical protein
MKKTITLLLATLVTNMMLIAQVPVNISTKVDGLRPIQTSQAAPNVFIPKFSTTIPVAKPTSCDVAGTGTKKFKSIALNTRNGGVWLIGEDDYLYGTGYHYSFTGLVSITGNSKVESLTSNFGAPLVYSKDGLGMMRGGMWGDEFVQKIQNSLPSFPMPNTKYAYTAPESTDDLWYLDASSNIKSATAATLATNIPPAKAAKMFTVYERRFFMIDATNQLWLWKPGFADWKKFGDIKAKFLTTEIGISTPLWYIGIDDQVYQLANDDPATTVPIPASAKAKSIAVFGSQLYYIGLDGYFYLRVMNKDIRVAL